MNTPTRPTDHALLELFDDPGPPPPGSRFEAIERIACEHDLTTISDYDGTPFEAEYRAYHKRRVPVGYLRPLIDKELWDLAERVCAIRWDAYVDTAIVFDAIRAQLATGLAIMTTQRRRDAPP